jgi:type I restriction enzyme S subunit
MQILDAISVQTDKVDALIANVQAQIEKLKAYKQSVITEVVTKGLDPAVPMKDSGIEWIGEMPDHWQLIRFRFIAKITTGNQDTQNADPDGAYPFYVRSPIVERCNTYTFDGEGILMAGDGAGAGRVFHLVDGKYAVHQRVYRFYDFKYMNPVLLKFYLENLFSTVIDYGSAKTTVPSVRLPMIQDFCVCVPPENEQQAMITVLSEKTEQIDQLIAIKQAKIEKLEQYKRSLIYEYVTGKKEVV